MSELLAKAIQKCSHYGQDHLLAYYDELDEEQKDALIRQILATDFEVVKECERANEPVRKGLIEPIEVCTRSAILENADDWSKRGIEEIRAGKVAAVLLAGGMGTRLGSDNPKGMYDVGITHPIYIFERIIGSLKDVADKAGAWIHLFIMTSDKNHDATVRFLKEKEFFGYCPDYVTFFKQSMAPATDYDGKILMENKYTLATSPNGNGGWFSSMIDAGLQDFLAENGIEWLNIFAVDNVLQKIADPVFIGATVAGGYVCGGKVIKKCAPDEKVGAICLEDGHPSIIEYMDFTEEYQNMKDENGDCAINYGVILNYLFRVDALMTVLGKKIPVHVVKKKIPYMAKDFSLVKPEFPNGYKYETLVVDMIKLLDNCLPFEVVRENEFAPVKNKTGVDSVESARKLLEMNGVIL